MKIDYSYIHSFMPLWAMILFFVMMVVSAVLFHFDYDWIDLVGPLFMLVGGGGLLFGFLMMLANDVTYEDKLPAVVTQANPNISDVHFVTPNVSVGQPVALNLLDKNVPYFCHLDNVSRTSTSFSWSRLTHHYRFTGDLKCYPLSSETPLPGK